MTAKLRSLAVAVATLALSAAGAAHADYVFSGSGNFGTLASASEVWAFNANVGQLSNWGSPGVGSGTVTYGGPDAAYGLQISFTGGGVIDAASVLVGNGANCGGGVGGGTTFCTIGPTDIWAATIVNPTTINFIAQDASFSLAQGQNYFVNIFFTGDTPTRFTGRWLTDFTGGVPEPATWALMLGGFGLAGAALRRRRAAALAA